VNISRYTHIHCRHQSCTITNRGMSGGSSKSDCIVVEAIRILQVDVQMSERPSSVCEGRHRSASSLLQGHTDTDSAKFSSPGAAFRSTEVMFFLRVNSVLICNCVINNALFCSGLFLY